tara:strand:- start:1612 stop:2133 length:522 start_codon:yes stop_codon:yes gene_type:complete
MEFQTKVRDILFNKILFKFSNQGFESYTSTRPEIWTSAFNNISLNPLFGTGAGSFPIFYEIENGFWVGHPHNIFLELSISYGIPVAVFTTSLLLYLLIKSCGELRIFKNLKNKSSLFDRAWWCSTFIFFILQFFDIQYFDLRLSILFWILVSGLINIINFRNEYSEIPKTTNM